MSYKPDSPPKVSPKTGSAESTLREKDQIRARPRSELDPIRTGPDQNWTRSELDPIRTGTRSELASPATASRCRAVFATGHRQRRRFDRRSGRNAENAIELVIAAPGAFGFFVARSNENLDGLVTRFAFVFVKRHVGVRKTQYFSRNETIFGNEVFSSRHGGPHLEIRRGPPCHDRPTRV
jgi:hypothetical protein